MKNHKPEQCIWLNEEEAIGLLELVLLSPGELTSEQRAAVIKLSDFCRTFLGEERASLTAAEKQRIASSPSVFAA